MLNIIDDEQYAAKNLLDNETVFHMLQVATVDGSAHLVNQFEDEKNGNKAHSALLDWYEGEKLTTDTAEDVRSKLEKIALTTRYSASEYINEFQKYTKLLNQLGEEYSQSHTTTIFLRQITGPDYKLTVQLCIEGKLELKECIDRIRSHERILSRETAVSRRPAINVRRDNIIRDKGRDIKEMNIEDYMNDKGFYSNQTRYGTTCQRKTKIW